MTRYLRLIGVRPDCVIASPAIRTCETAEIMCNQYKITDIKFLVTILGLLTAPPIIVDPTINIPQAAPRIDNPKASPIPK